MAQILIVDKDKLHNMSLGLALSAHDHAVQVTSSGREAIDLGLHTRPDVLVVEWILEDDFNGVEVAESLRAIHPAIHAILVTAHASGDLRKLAKTVGFAGFLEKPVAGEGLAKGIRNVLTRSPQPCRRLFGFLEYSRAGKIFYSNAPARELLGLQGKEGIQQVFSVRSQSELAYTKGAWIELSRSGEEKQKTWGYARSGGKDVNFLFLLEPGDEKAKKDAVLAKLRLSDEVAPADVSTADRVLILDPDPLQRRLATTQLQSLRCPFHSVESSEAVFKILESKEAISVLFVDYAAVAEGGEAFLDRVRSACPGLAVVGFSSQYRGREFKALGAEGFVIKPLVGETLRRILERVRNRKSTPLT